MTTPTRSRPEFTSIVAVLVMVGWSAWMASSHLAHGAESYYRQHDAAEAHGAFQVGQAAYAERDLLGNWLPNALAGVDARANAKGAQPLIDAVYRFVPYWWTSGLLVAVQTFIAAFFTVLLLRRLAVSLVPALLAGLAYSMMYDGAGAHSGFFLPVGFLVPGFAALVLALMSVGDRRVPIAIAGGGLTAVVLGLLTGPNLAVIASPLVAWWMFVVERGTIRHAVTLAVFGLGIVVMTAPLAAAMAMHAADGHRLLWPSVMFTSAEEAVQRVARAEEALLSLRIHGPLLIPAVLGWLAGGYRCRALSALLVACSAIIGLQWGMVWMRAILEEVAPALQTFQVDRIAQFLHFLAPAAGAVGLEQLWRLLRDRESRALRGAGIVIVGVVSLAVAGVLIARSIVINNEREVLRRYPSTYAGMLQQTTLIRLAEQMRSEPLARVVTFADRNQGFSGQHAAFAWAQGLETADGYLNLYPVTYHTFWAWVMKPAFELRPDLLEYFDEWGNMLYLFNPYADRASPSTIAMHQIANLRLLGLANVRYLITAIAFDDPDLVPWSGNDGSPTAEVQWTPTESGSVVRKLFVYENRHWLPRFFVARQTRTFPKPDALLGAMATATIGQLQATAFLLDEQWPAALPIDGGSDAPPGNVVVTRYSADTIELDVRTDAPGVLVVSNGFSRYWQAQVNSVPVGPVMRVNFGFQGVRVPAGSSRIRLDYAPPYAVSPWLMAALVVFVSITLAGGWVLSVRLRARLAMLTSRVWWVTGVGLVTVGVVVAVGRIGRSEVPERPWAVESSTHRLSFTVRPKGLSTPTDLPILIERTPADEDFWRVAPATADGLLFVDALGNRLAHDVERYDSQRRQLAVWVLVPALGWGSRQVDMYVGGGATLSNRQEQVWGTAYVGVWHMNDVAYEGRIPDRSPSGRHAVVAAGLAGRWQTEGRIAGGLALRGAEGISVPEADVLNFGLDDWGIDFWIKPAPLAGRNFGFLQHGASGVFQIYLHSENMLVLERNSEGRVGDHSFAGVKLVFDQWSHVSLNHRAGRLQLSVNGDLRSTFEGPSDFVHRAPPLPLWIGRGTYGGLDGILDEVRVYRGPRPPGWNRAVYLAQTGGLVRYGALERRTATQ